MKYPKDFYSRADRIIQDRRMLSYEIRLRRQDDVKMNYPEVYKIFSEMNSNIADEALSLLRSNSTDKEKIFAIQRQYTDRLLLALEEAGLPHDYLSNYFTCELCKDTGIKDGKSCKCRIELLNKFTYEMLSNVSKIDNISFDNFSLDYYKNENKGKMAKVIESSKQFSRRFPDKCANLLFMGNTGLGKTHLSVSIAKEVVSRGYLVIYASAPVLFQKLVDAMFNGQDASLIEYRELVYGADLLIIDDLGTEFRTQPTLSETYNLINTRINENKVTIINTNLTLPELESTYGQRVVSRLIGESAITSFSGTDIRYQKRVGV